MYSKGMDKQARPALDQSLTDAEYDRMEAILERFSGEDSMNLEELDGFFAALICGPVPVSPASHLEEIWGRASAPFDTTDDLEEFLNLAMRHWNFAARVLGAPDMVFVPTFIAQDEAELPLGNRWAKGFLRGVALYGDGWREIFENEDKFAMLLPMLALQHENDSDPEMRTWETTPDRQLRESLLVGLSVSTQRLYDHFRSRNGRETRNGEPTIRAAGKVGRNDPCYCGSGKKYKRCCGNVLLQ